MRRALGKGALAALGLCVWVAAPASAQQDRVPWGTIEAPGARALAAAAPQAAIGCSPDSGACDPVFGPIAGASLATGGCGLRNRGDCGFDITNVRGPASVAILVWAVILGGDVTSPSDPKISTVALSHNEFGVGLTGTLIGSGGSPCWGGGPIAVYYAAVPLSIINSTTSPTPGNGHYQVFVTPGGSGVTTGEDPWSGTVIYPLFEGAGLIIVGPGTGTVYGWGGSLFSGFTVFGGSIDYLLGIPTAPTPGAVANLVSMVADGQIGTGAYTASAGLAVKSTAINGVTVAGAGSPILPGSILNGDTAAPLPRLFDVAEIDIGTMGAFANPSSTPGFPASMAFHVEAGTDCLTLMAHALEIH